MKKLLGILGAMGMIASTGLTVVACGNKTESIGKVSADKTEIKSKEDAVTVTVELEKDLTEADKVTLTSDKGTSSIIKIENGTKENKKITFKVTLKTDLPSTNAKEILTAKLNDKKVGNVEINISKSEEGKRTKLNLSIIKNVIGEGIGVNSNDIKNQEKVKETLIIFAKKLLNQYGFTIDVDILLSMVNVSYLKNDSKLAVNNQDKIAFVNLEMIEGKEETLDGYHITGSAKIKIFEQNKLEDVLKVKELGKLKIKSNTSESDKDFEIRQAIKEKNLETGMNSNNIYDISIKNISIEGTSGKAQVEAVLGKSFSSESAIQVTFTVNGVE